jgi:uncharacterized membrane protein YhfC
MDILARILNAVLMIFIPLAIGAVLARKLRAEWRIFGLGMMTFVVSQVFHLPFNAWLLNPFIEQTGLVNIGLPKNLMAVALLYGLSAGIFEEVTRYIGFRLWLKSERDFPTALMFGTGHGGMEAILLGILTLYAFFQLLALRNADLVNLLDAQQIDRVRLQLSAYWSAPWYVAVMGAVERAATLCFHVSAAVLVLQAFKRRNLLWLLAAMGWHALLDAVAVFAARTWNIFIAEGLIISAGLLSLALIYVLREFPSKPDRTPPPEGLVSPRVEINELQIENLEDSRYV